MHGFRSGAILLILICATTIRAENGRFTAAVVLPKIQMRSGHSWQFPAVGELKKGEQVLVHHEEDNWVAIYPPPGSVSWIQARFLGRVDPNLARQNVEVVIDPSAQAEVHVVSPASPKDVNRIYQVKLPRGSIVEVIGGAVPVKDDTTSTTWYPITPPEGEFRWIPKQAIGTPSPAAPPPEFVRNDPQNTKTVVLRGDPKTPGSGIATPPLPAGWEKAEETERAGNYLEAERQYTFIYQRIRTQEVYRELALVCFNRIVRCQERQKLEGFNNPRGTPPPTPRPTSSSNSPPTSYSSPMGTASGNDVVAARSRSTNETAQESPGIGSGQRWTGPGILRRAGSPIDDKPAYALMDSKGRIICYATASPGVDLDRYLNQSVSLYGSLETRGTIRGGPYMVVAQTK